MSIKPICRYSSIWCRRGKSWSRHQNCKRIRLVHTLVMSIKPICRYSSIWCRRRGKSWSRHQNCKRIGWVHTLVMSIKPICRYSSIWCRRGKSGHGTKIARGLDGYMGFQHKFMSINSMGLLKLGATRCHGTRIARGVPLPVYINLDLYSGF